eukprot:TRINITY_DN8508_c0_g2_i1.p1 TRINITY_DN8508_c0_g2~~TRINITY_DN8508_c0_g2_i1.p1  ORF type:complete len:300 (+),score=50.37 TRINITY_DN8508_c0_g2_i1:58-957(+)
MSNANAWDDLWDDEDLKGGAELIDNYPSWLNKDGVVFLIDAQVSMFQAVCNINTISHKKTSEGEIPFENAVKCTIATLSDKIISTDSDLVGVCFYGTRESENSNNFSNIVVFQGNYTCCPFLTHSELEMPDAQRILDLEVLLKCDFASKFGHTNTDFPMCDAFWTCSTIFSTTATKIGHKRVFLFTNEDNPCSTDPHVRAQSIQRAKDLAELGIDIELFSMNKPDQVFDPRKFYMDIISVDDEDNDGTWNFHATSKFEELRQRVRRKEFKKRCFCSSSGINAEYGITGMKMKTLLYVEC